MNNLTEFQQRAASVAVVKMLGGKHFSIVDLDAIAQTIGRKSAMAGTDYAALRGLHCVDWADMGRELADMTREKCLELLGLPPQTMEMVKPITPTEPAAEPAKRLWIEFWK